MESNQVMFMGVNAETRMFRIERKNGVHTAYHMDGRKASQQYGKALLEGETLVIVGFNMFDAFEMARRLA